jgi:hypothetical protein
MSAYKYVVVGGGNSAGYVAREFAQSEGFGPGQLLIVTDEPVSGLLCMCGQMVWVAGGVVCSKHTCMRWCTWVCHPWALLACVITLRRW